MKVYSANLIIREGEEMLQFTPEEIVKAGEFLGRGILARASVDERLEGLAPNDVLEHYSVEQRLQSLNLEEILAYVKGIVGEAS